MAQFTKDPFTAPFDVNPEWLELGNEFCEVMEEIGRLGELALQAQNEDVCNYLQTHTIEETLQKFDGIFFD